MIHLLVAASVFLSAAASAAPERALRDSGTSIGNGGQSIVCETHRGKSAEAFDLYEGRVLLEHRPVYPETVNAYELALELASKVDESQGGARRESETVRGKVRYIKERMRLLPPGVGLKLTDDSLEFIVPKNCTIVQTINFRDNLQIYADSDVWNSLPPTSQAALYLHEAIYWQLREGGQEDDSRRTRRMVSFLMSGGSLPPRAKIPLPTNSEAQYCHSSTLNRKRDWNTKFFAYRQEGKLVLQFLQIGGFRLLGKAELVTDAALDTEALPLQKFKPTPGKAEGWIGSPPESEIFALLNWGQGRLDIEGFVQQGVAFSDQLDCHDWMITW